MWLFYFLILRRFPKFNRPRGLDVAVVFLRQPGWGVFGHATPGRIPDKGYITTRSCGSVSSSAIRTTPPITTVTFGYFICTAIVELTKSGEFLNMVRNYKRKRDAVKSSEESLKLAVYAVLVLSMPIRILRMNMVFANHHSVIMSRK